MQSLLQLRKKIESAEELSSVVRTMKTMAAVNIRQYERAVSSLAEYRRSVRYGFQALSIRDPQLFEQLGTEERSGRVGIIVLGSDQGMCGAFNERVGAEVDAFVDGLSNDATLARLLPIGHRIAARVAREEWPLEEDLRVPGSLDGVDALVRALIVRIEEWQSTAKVDRVVVFHNVTRPQLGFETRQFRLLPLDRHWLRQIAEERWTTRSIPDYPIDGDALLSSLVREYLTVELFGATAESMAAENATRLSAMQAAERNLDRKLDELRHNHRTMRQSVVTEELFDIIAGYRAFDVD